MPFGPALSCGWAIVDGVVSIVGRGGGGRIERTEPRPVADAAAPPLAALSALRPAAALAAADEEDEKALIDIGVDLIDKENSLRREREKAPFGSKLRQSENKCVNDGGQKKLFYKKTLSSVLLSFTQPPARRLP